MDLITNEVKGRATRRWRVGAMGLFWSCTFVLAILLAACAGVRDNGTDLGTLATQSADAPAPAASPPEGGEPGVAVALEGDPAAGQQLAQQQGCVGCHSVDGAQGAGPTWQGLFGSEIPLASGETVTADAEYIQNSILNPQAQIHEGFAPIMPSYAGQLSDQQIADLIAYIESLSE